MKPNSETLRRLLASGAPAVLNDEVDLVRCEELLASVLLADSPKLLLSRRGVLPDTELVRFETARGRSGSDVLLFRRDALFAGEVTPDGAGLVVSDIFGGERQLAFFVDGVAADLD